MIWFTSDTHYGHANIIKYCQRPFPDLDAMNRAMITNWNAVVGPRDTVYHLGDFAMGKAPLIPTYRQKLNGAVCLIKGNHDRSTTQMQAAGFQVYEELFLTLDGVRLYLHHQPMPVQHWRARADYHLCGHVHELWARKDRIINVGVDVRCFRPWSLEELLSSPSTS